MKKGTVVTRDTSRLTIEIYSHHYSVTGFNSIDRETVLSFCRQFAQMGLKMIGRGKFIRGMLRVFVGVTLDRTEFRFHINTLEDFYTHIANYGIKSSNIKTVTHKAFVPAAIELNYIDTRTPREYQAPLIEYIVASGKFKIVTLDPGRGKTFIALSAIRDLKVRTFFCIKAQYIEKWISDTEEAFDIKPGELMVIRGTSNLKKLLELAKEGELTAKIILCSNSTFQRYLKDYEKYKNRITEFGYPCKPHEIWKLMGIGLKVVDESHETLHFNYRLETYTHVAKTLALSGTLFSDDPFITRMQDIMHPPEYRLSETDRHIYVAAEALLYNIENVDAKVKYINHGMKSYTHVKFEQSILKSKVLLDQYINMVVSITQDRFVNKMEKGQRMAIYFSTKEMCTIASGILSKEYPDLNVVRYIGEDDYEDMLDGDIIVTTLKSLGTAIDVPGLRVILLTDALGSMQLNIQVMGRLRPLKGWDDVTPEFLFLVCQDIDKHIEYYNKKKEIFHGRVVSFNTTSTGVKM